MWGWGKVCATPLVPPVYGFCKRECESFELLMSELRTAMKQFLKTFSCQKFPIIDLFIKCDFQAVSGKILLTGVA